MKKVLALAISLGIFIFIPLVFSENANAKAKTHVALVIGNAKYTDTSVDPLRNAVNDSRAVRDALKRLGYTVIYGENLDYGGMNDTFNKFFKLATASTVSLFYYSGHGIQINGQNFLIPTDADFSSNVHFNRSIISISDLVHYIDVNSKSGVIFLDACRKNPFRKKIGVGRSAGVLQMSRSMGRLQLEIVKDGATGRGFMPEKADDNNLDKFEIGNGLAKIDAADGMFISFATRPGELALDGRGKHSPFTAGLLQYIEAKNLLITQIASRVANHVKKLTRGTQTPWTAFSLTVDLYLAIENHTGTRRVQKVINKRNPRSGSTSSRKRTTKSRSRAKPRNRLDSPRPTIGFGAGGL